MKAAIISIGDELLIGQTINTNASWMGQELTKIGVNVCEVLAISDSETAIISALKLYQNKYELVLITGGLGPTKDDITKKTLAKHFDSNLITNQEALDNVLAFFKAFNREISDINKLQALVLQKGEVLINKAGTAPGTWIKKEKTVYVSMPGVPREMKYLMINEVIPKIKANYNLPVIYNLTLLTQGIGESYISDLIADIEDNLPSHIKFAYLPSQGMVKFRITARGVDKSQLQKEVTAIANEIKSRLDFYYYGENEDSLADIIGQLLKKNQQTLSTAESLSSGSVAREITSVPGSSAYFIGGIISYDARVKVNELKVAQSLIDEHNVVSEQVAKAMAEGARQKFASDYAIATTGLAGPDGGSELIPIGTVYIAVASPKTTTVVKFNMGNERSAVLRRTTLSALNLLRKVIILANN